MGQIRLLVLFAAMFVASLALAADHRIAGIASDRYASHLASLYTDLHRHPELSGAEIQTSARLAKELRTLGFAVTEGVGGHGVVGVLKNGNGPTVMLRTDMDALPIEERTGAAYASETPGVMHACGHDVHMAVWVGAAHTLVAEHKRWRGTLIMVAQPAEELGTGARVMLDDGLYARFGKPDFALAIHDTERLPAGKVELIPGFAGASVDTVTITIQGKGAHGARPHLGIDPIVIASATVMRLQTIASREIDPVQPVIVTVGSFHAGTKGNIIPESAELELTVRTRDEAVREATLAAIERIAAAESAAAGAPAPTVVIERGPAAPYNDPAVVARLLPALQRTLGEDNAHEAVSRSMGGEDFGEYLKDGVVGSMIYVGAIDPALFAAWEAGTTQRYGIHSPLFAPAPERTIVTGAIALATSALELFNSR
jgi:hippurate hydrolase